LVQSKISDDFRVLAPETTLKKYLSKLRPVLDSLPVRLYKHRSKTLFSTSYLPFSDMVERINTLNPDIVHLHWITSGMMRIEDVARINAPIVWSLHDDWAITGGCHIKWDCERFKAQCGLCPRLGSNRENDLSRKVFNRKKETYSKIRDLTVIGLSRWMVSCVNESSLFSNRNVLNIPNPIDVSTFSPFSKNDARKLFNLPSGKKLVLFGANSATSDINKGFSELSVALESVDAENTELIIFGSSEPQIAQGFKQKVHYLGHLYDDVSLRIIYNAADVMVVPSLQESFGQTAVESMACGTPVVAFGATGLLDIVDHLENGYLATPYDTSDLARGIEIMLNADNYAELCQNARDKILREFDSSIVADKFIELYEKLIINPVL
ncbi:MAG TPA: glycosyltransferase, partial [Methylophaga sp.]|nr:glycosyltransferase [Methylophaga sp.]